MLGFLIIFLLVMLALLIFMLFFAIIDDIMFDYKISNFICKLVKKTKSYKAHEINKRYKEHLSNLGYKNDVVELPFSVVQPLLHNDSPIIYCADKEKLILAKDKYHYNKIYIKLSKKDYKEYYNYLIQKKENEKHIKQTENTLKATKLIQAELNRINEEALKSIEVEKEKIENITDNLSNNGLNNIAEIYKFIGANDTYYYIDSYGRRFWKDEAGNQYMSVTK